MNVAFDSSSRFSQYAYPAKLVSTQWLQEHLGDDGLVVAESDEDVLLYETGHIPGAVKIDWHTDLNDSIERDFIDGSALAELLSKKGIGPQSTIVLYGDKSNWWAAYALWVLTLFGHSDVRLLDGGRAKWIEEGRPLSTETPKPERADYPELKRDDRTNRAWRSDVLAHFGNPLVDVRSTEEYTGERTEIPGYPSEGALRAGHIPGAKSIPWARAAAEDGTFRPRAELEQIYLNEAELSSSDAVITYCRIGERSSHTWFVLKYLLGFKNVRNYDGSWTEWGSSVGVPIVQGKDAGLAPKPLLDR